jgi:hypothetical protein
LQSIITKPGSASENTIYADLAFAASSPGLEKMAILNHIYKGDRQSKITPYKEKVCLPLAIALLNPGSGYAPLLFVG